jgi:hypothetical protein
VTHHRFHGAIAGAGSTSGVRVVVGRWERSPLGRFADVMVEDAQGHRTLLAPTDEVADFVAGTYVFDEVVITPVEVVDVRDGWLVRAAPHLDLELGTGDRALVGWLLHAAPARLATSPIWSALVDPFARVLLRGVRTRGVARVGRREWYSATDLHRVDRLTGSWRGRDLGTLAPVDPPCRFGFSSTPRTPSVTRVVTTVEA